MQEVNIRTLLHNFSELLQLVKKGETITVCERNKPVADLVPHNENTARPGWKREITRIKVEGESFSETVRTAREED